MFLPQPVSGAWPMLPIFLLWSLHLRVRSSSPFLSHPQISPNQHLTPWAYQINQAPLLPSNHSISPTVPIQQPFLNLVPLIKNTLSFPPFPASYSVQFLPKSPPHAGFTSILVLNIPELDFEIPPEAQRGKLSTVEGILSRAADELQALQEERKKIDPQTAEAIDNFLLKLRKCVTGDSSFTFILDDPAGNSFIENPYAPSLDPALTIKFFERTPEQTASLGYLVDQSQLGEAGDGASTGESNSAIDQEKKIPHGSIGAVAGHHAIAQGNSAEMAEALFRYSAPEEVMTFPSTCGACATRCETRMYVTNIPYFQEVIVMASTCDSCGYRSSELKPGGRIPEKGKKITVCVKNIKDLSRDLIKSDTASVRVPELDLELASGTLGGIVTTVEGLITKISENLGRVHGFTFGDSLDEFKKSKWQNFRTRLEKLLNLEETWTLIIDDALANSFVAPITDDIKDDHQLSFEEYERSWEQNEELGLNDMDTSSADVVNNSPSTTVDQEIDRK